MNILTLGHKIWDPYYGILKVLSDIHDVKLASMQMVSIFKLPQTLAIGNYIRLNESL
jgi:hypothetical protein